MAQLFIHGSENTEKTVEPPSIEMDLEENNENDELFVEHTEKDFTVEKRGILVRRGRWTLDSQKVSDLMKIELQKKASYDQETVSGKMQEAIFFTDAKNQREPVNAELDGLVSERKIKKVSFVIKACSKSPSKSPRIIVSKMLREKLNPMISSEADDSERIKRVFTAQNQYKKYTGYPEIRFKQITSSATESNKESGIGISNLLKQETSVKDADTTLKEDSTSSSSPTTIKRNLMTKSVLAQVKGTYGPKRPVPTRQVAGLVNKSLERQPVKGNPEHSQKLSIFTTSMKTPNAIQQKALGLLKEMNEKMSPQPSYIPFKGEQRSNTPRPQSRVSPQKENFSGVKDEFPPKKILIINPITANQNTSQTSASFKPFERIIPDAKEIIPATPKFRISPPKVRRSQSRDEHATNKVVEVVDQEFPKIKFVENFLIEPVV